jgi:hypothetical protein
VGQLSIREFALGKWRIEGENMNEFGVGQQEVGDTLGPLAVPRADDNSSESGRFRPARLRFHYHRGRDSADPPSTESTRRK